MRISKRISFEIILNQPTAPSTDSTETAHLLFVNAFLTAMGEDKISVLLLLGFADAFFFPFSKVSLASDLPDYSGSSHTFWIEISSLLLFYFLLFFSDIRNYAGLSASSIATTRSNLSRKQLLVACHYESLILTNMHFRRKLDLEFHLGP